MFSIPAGARTIMHPTRCVALFILCLFASVLCDAAHSRIYSTTEPDANLNKLRDELAARTMSRDEIQAKFEQLRAEIQKLDRTDDIRRQLDALQQAVLGHKQTDDRVGKLSGEIDTLKVQMPTFPGWVSPLAAFVGVILSAVVAWFIAKRNRQYSDVQRAQDKADSYLQNLNTAYDQIAEAMGFLNHPEALNHSDAKERENNRNKLRAVGNLYNSIGISWRNGDVSEPVLRREGIDAAARDFRLALRRAADGLGKPDYLEELLRRWDGLDWLAARPDHMTGASDG